MKRMHENNLFPPCMFGRNHPKNAEWAHLFPNRKPVEELERARQNIPRAHTQRGLKHCQTVLTGWQSKLLGATLFYLPSSKDNQEIVTQKILCIPAFSSFAFLHEILWQQEVSPTLSLTVTRYIQAFHKANPNIFEPYIRLHCSRIRSRPKEWAQPVFTRNIPLKTVVSALKLLTQHS